MRSPGRCGSWKAVAVVLVAILLFAVFFMTPFLQYPWSFIDASWWLGRVREGQAIVVAIESYKKHRGALPASLENLIPEHLSGVSSHWRYWPFPPEAENGQTKHFELTSGGSDRWVTCFSTTGWRGGGKFCRRFDCGFSPP